MTAAMSSELPLHAKGSADALIGPSNLLHFHFHELNEGLLKLLRGRQVGTRPGSSAPLRTQRAFCEAGQRSILWHSSCRQMPRDSSPAAAVVLTTSPVSMNRWDSAARNTSVLKVGSGVVRSSY